MPLPQRLIRTLALGLVLLATPVRAELEVDVELVLAADISSSMDMGERYLQRLGHIEALRHPAVLRAIRAGLHGRIAVTYFEWSDPHMQRVILPWTVVEDAATAAAAAATIEAAPPLDGIRTSISGALERATGMLAENGFSGLRRIIDIAGDEPNNAGPPLAEARAAALARDITINGLAIMLRTSPRATGDTATLDRYFADALIGGPLAFVMTVRHPDDLVEAIRRKLVLEIAGLTPPGRAGDRRLR